MTYSEFSLAQKYIKHIRNEAKTQYAQNYLDFLVGRKTEEPDYRTFGIQPMTAQAVRHNLAELCVNHP